MILCSIIATLHGSILLAIALTVGKLILALVLADSLMEATIAMFRVTAVFSFWIVSCSLLSFVHDLCFFKLLSSRSSAINLFIFSVVSHDWLFNL